MNGKLIVFIGVIHTLFGVIGLREIFAEIIGEGLVNTVNGQPSREFAFWFVAFGILGIIFGALIDWNERNKVKLPRFLGWSILAAILLMLVVMPASGGWLLLIPAFGIIYNTRRNPNVAESSASK